MAYTNIDDPSAHFQTTTYTGSNNQSITNDGNSDLKPDFVWIKRRSNADHHSLTNSSLGVNKQLLSSSSNAEQSRTDQIQSFNTDGFTLGIDGAGYTNVAGNTYVAWQWKANGGTTASNTSGSITSTVQANTDAGFNIVTYTGNGANSNFGHGMGEQPDMVIVKNRTSAANWCVWHKDLTSSYYLQLDTTNSQQSGPWDGLDPSSGVVYIYSGGLVNASGSDYVAYIFKGKQGYSKFGSFVGNGNDNGPFVYTGFKPAFVLMKITTSAGYYWRLLDTTRSTSNESGFFLMPNNTDAEFNGLLHSSHIGIDFLSNGFKIRSSHPIINESGSTSIYMAFAENPFTTSTGVPTTAR